MPIDQVNTNLYLSDQVQPICLPTVDDLQTATSDQLMIYTFKTSPILEKITISSLSPAECKTECEFYYQIGHLVVSTDSANVVCLGNISSYNGRSLVGFHSRRNGVQQFVLLGGIMYCDENSLFLKFSFENQINWIYENMENI